MGMSSSQPQPITQGTMGSPSGTGGGMPAGHTPFSQNSPVAWARPVGGMNNIMNNMGGNPQQTPSSPTKNYGPVSDMLGSAQNQVNPQSSPTGTMNNLMGSLPGQNTAPQQNGPTQFTPGQNGMSGGMMPTNYTPQQPMGNPGFMPMGNAGFMPMGFGQMPQQPQMPTFGGPRPGKSPQ